MNKRAIVALYSKLSYVDAPIDVFISVQKRCTEIYDIPQPNILDISYAISIISTGKSQMKEIENDD